MAIRVGGRSVVCLMMVALAPAVFGQTRLNPTVKVLPKPTSIVPPECLEGLAPAVPRALVEAVAETPAATTTIAPPSSDLRTRLRRVQAAAENNDYNGFKTALAEARAAVSAYPAGGEKQSSNDVLQVYADIERLWDYSITNPTGAFFTASNEDLLTMLRKYPGFPRAVTDATMTISGETIYPSHETRQFLTDEAAKRLARLGIKTPTRVVQERPRITTPRLQPRPKAQPQPRAAVTPHRAPRKPAATKPAVHKRLEKAAKPAPTPSTKIAQAVPKPAVHKREEKRAQPAPSSGGQPPTAVQAPTPTRTPAPTPTPAPAPVSTATATTKTAEPTTGTTATTASQPAPTTTTATTSSAEKPPSQGSGMNLTFAIILIVVGIGVLIVLFRASD